MAFSCGASAATYFKHFLSLTKGICLSCRRSYGLRIIDLHAWEVSLSAFTHIYKHTNKIIPRSIA